MDQDLAFIGGAATTAGREPSSPQHDIFVCAAARSTHHISEFRGKDDGRHLPLLTQQTVQLQAGWQMTLACSCLCAATPVTMTIISISCRC